MNISLAEQVSWRFIKAGLSSAFSTAATVTFYTGVQTWTQFATATSALILCLIIGFITGVVMAVQKYLQGPTISIASSMPESLLE